MVRETVEEKGLIFFTDIKEVADSSVDVLISNHALEHVDNPPIYIREFRRVVKNGGKVVIVVPHEISDEVNPCDINKHLYTWTPQNLYNLLVECNIDVVKCERIYHAWLPKDREILEKFGWKEFHQISKVRAEKNDIYQTIAVGHVLKSENDYDNSIIRSDDGIYKKYCIQMNQKWKNTKSIIDSYKKIAIYGAGTAGETLYRFLREKEYFPDCFVVSTGIENKASINGVNIIPLDKLSDKKDYLYILGVKNSTIKKEIQAELKKIGCNAVLDFDFDIIETNK